jgi:malate synthase
LRSAHQKGGKRPAIIVRPRSLNLNEDHVLVDGEPVPGAIFDFGVWMYNYHQITNKYNLNVEEGPYFYIPKLENHLEARLWNDIITFTEQHFNMVKVRD